MAVEIASAYVSLVPSFKGGSARIARELGGAKAGKMAGDAAGKGFLGSIGASAKKAAGVIGLALGGAAVVGGIKNSIGAAAELETKFREVVTLFGETGPAADKSFKQVRGQVRQLSNQFGIAQETLVGGLYQAISAGVPRENAFEFMQVASKAAVGGVTDVETAVDGITTIINAFGLEAEDAQRVSDAMFTAVKGGKTNFEELSGALFNVAPAAAAANVSMEEVNAAIATLTAGGTPTSVATTQIRAALDGLQKPSEDLDKIFQQLGYDNAQLAIESEGLSFALDAVKEASNGNNGELQKLLGSSEAVAAANVLAGTGAKKFADELENQANAAGATNDAFGEVNKSAARQFEVFKNQLRNIGISIGQALLPALTAITGWLSAALPHVLAFGREMGQRLAPVLRQVGDFIQGHVVPALREFGRFLVGEIVPAAVDLGRALVSAILPPLRQFGQFLMATVLPAAKSLANLIGSSVVPVLQGLAKWVRENSTLIGALAAGLGGAVLAMKAYQGAVLLINGVTRAWAAVQRVLNVVLRANPIGIVVTALAALVGGLTYAWKNSETFRNVVTGVWNAIKSVVMTVVNAVVSTVTSAWDRIRDVTSRVWNAIRGVVETIFKVIKTIVTTYFNIYRKIIETVWNVVRAITMAVWNRISGVLEFIWKLISGLAKTYFGIWRAIFQLGWKAVQKITQAVWAAIRKILEVVWGVIRRVATSFFNTYKTVITSVWGVIRDVTMAVWTRIRNFLRASFEFIRDRVVNPIRTVMGWITDRARNVRDNVVSAFRTMRDRLRGVFEWIRDNVVGPIRRQFQRIWDKAIDVKDGVVDAFSSVAETIQGAFEGITDGIKSALNWVFGKINDWMISPINALLGAVGVDKIPELPQFHTGGWVSGRGEVPAVLLSDEAVLNRRAAKTLGREGVDHFNKTGELLPMGGFFDDAANWLDKNVKQGIIVGIESATGQNLGDGLLAAVRSAGNAGLDKLGDLASFPGISRDYSVAGTKRFFNGLLDVVEAGENTINEDMAKRKNHGSLPHPDDFGNGFAGVAGKVLPPGTYRIGRGAAAHGYNARDLPAPTGTPIYAAAAGTVNRAASLGYSYGIHAGINHGKWSTLYAHMSRRYVGVGDVVRKGQMIGRVGSTGNSTGPHLHLEPDLARLYDRGGYLPTGMSLVYNGTGQPERVLDPKETLAYEKYGGASTINMYGPLHEQAQQIKNQMDRDRVLRGRS